MKTRVCIIGAGPAGLFAAIHSAAAGAETTVVEANTAPGRKLLVTGGGRCNLTHCDSMDQLIKAFGSKGRFLSHSFYEFPPEKVINFFAERGLRTRVEADGCAFPVTDRATDVRDIIVAEVGKLGVDFVYDARVRQITPADSSFAVESEREQIRAEKLVIATGGASWPQTGSKGDGYDLAKQLGHNIIPIRPSLVPLATVETWPAELAGTSLDNVTISARLGSRKLKLSGPMLFTQDGIGGPTVLNLSASLADLLPAEAEPLAVSLDLVPETSEGDLQKQFVDLLTANPKRQVANILTAFVSRRLAFSLCRQIDCHDDTLACQFNKHKRRDLVHLLKALPLSIRNTRPIAEATITRGGVDTTQIDRLTMASKLQPGLFFAGEVIDVDGPCGGYNLQICWSTGALAGRFAAGP